MNTTLLEQTPTPRQSLALEDTELGNYGRFASRNEAAAGSVGANQSDPGISPNPASVPASKRQGEVNGHELRPAPAAVPFRNFQRPTSPSRQLAALGSLTKVFTDGACRGNPGPGGWGAVIMKPGGATVEFSGGANATTNNRMELTATIEALKQLPAGSRVVLTTDSEHVINGMTKGWKIKTNLDLWSQLRAEAAKHQVTWHWVRGHAGHAENERCDALARRAVPRRQR